jgi:hypothetical protein
MMNNPELPELIGLKAHTHAQRLAIAQALLALFERKFGDNLLAVALTASMARGDDQAYSDLELDVFLRQLPPPGEDRFLQRIVDGLLVEAVYYTPESYLQPFLEPDKDWYIAASDVLVPLSNPALVAELNRRRLAAPPDPTRLGRLAAKRMYEAQEALGKTLAAIEAGNRQGLPLLLCDAVLHILVVLAFLNARPFTTFGRFIEQARRFPLQPEGLDGLLELLVEGKYSDLALVKRQLVGVFASLEQLFITQGLPLYDQSPDPNLPNR